MRIRHTLVISLLAAGLLAACDNEIRIESEEAVGASGEVQALVAEIDAMLETPQEEYPEGSAFSAVFEALFEEVVKQRRTLRTDRVSKNMGYFIATGHQIGWDPQEADIERLAADWGELRTDVLAGP